LNLALNPLSCKTLVSGCGFLFTLYLIHLSVNQKIKKLLHFLEMLIFPENIFRIKIFFAFVVVTTIVYAINFRISGFLQSAYGQDTTGI